MTPTELRARRAQVWSQMQDLDKRASDANRPMDQEELNQWNALDAELVNLETNVARADKQADYETRFEARPEQAVVNAGGDVSADPAPEPDKRYAEAFAKWLKHGTEDLQPEQRAILRSGFTTAKEFRAQGVSVTTAGGYNVPALFREKLVETEVTFGSVRAVAEVITTETGASLPWPTMNDTANVGAILAENTAVTEQDVTLGQGTLDVYMYTSKLVRASLQLIQDDAFGVDSWLTRVLGQRLGRIANQHFTTGTGTGQPEGIQTNATSGVTLPTGNTTSVTYDGLVDVIESVDPAYRVGASWMFRNLSAVRKLKDTTNQPLWQPSLTADAPTVLLGYPVVVNPDMPAAAASTKSILFGNFREGYLIRDVLEVQTLRLTERYADFLQVGFLAFQRFGGKPQNTAAYRAITQSAT